MSWSGEGEKGVGHGGLGVSAGTAGPATPLWTERQKKEELFKGPGRSENSVNEQK